VCTHVGGAAATQNVRCLVSINFGSTGCSTAAHLSYLSFSFILFYGAICPPRPRALICQLAICRCRCDLTAAVSKHMDHLSANCQARSRSSSVDEKSEKIPHRQANSSFRSRSVYAIKTRYVSRQMFSRHGTVKDSSLYDRMPPITYAAYESSQVDH